MRCASASPTVVSELIGDLLISDAGGALHGRDAWSLTLADRDRLVAELYRWCFGSRMVGRLQCEQCGEPFDVDFSLDDLLQDVEQTVREAFGSGVRLDESGVFQLPGGERFRAPRMGDERAILGEGAERAHDRLLEACADGQSGKLSDAALSALESVAPVLDFELPVACAHCQVEQRARFDVVDYFLAALRTERAILVREVHCLATAYGWPHKDILDLPRSVRREYVALVLAERRAGVAS